MTMTAFILVSAIVLFSILWDSTEDFRKRLWNEIGF